jgi:shikimate dehydrogenase
MGLRLGLIGYPAKHSLSPWIHERFLQQSNVKGSYTIEEIRPEYFDSKITRVIREHFDGFNVTLPYKQKIIPYLDELDDNAAKIGAVNTVVNVDGRLIGYNTDGTGYVRSLEESFPEILKKKTSRILVIGAGGAARGIYVALNQSGFVAIDIANRTRENAVAIANSGNKSVKTEVLSLKQAQENIQDYEIIIQTTNIGMIPNAEDTPFKLPQLHKHVIVSDIIYRPIWTKFLKEADEKGASILHGHLMLLYQAQYAFEIWTGSRPKLGEMNKQLKQILKG